MQLCPLCNSSTAFYAIPFMLFVFPISSYLSLLPGADQPGCRSSAHSGLRPCCHHSPVTVNHHHLLLRCCRHHSTVAVHIHWLAGNDCRGSTRGHWTHRRLHNYVTTIRGSWHWNWTRRQWGWHRDWGGDWGGDWDWCWRRDGDGDRHRDGSRCGDGCGDGDGLWGVVLLGWVLGGVAEDV